MSIDNKDVIGVKKKYTKYLIMLIVLVVILICCWRINTINNNNKKVDIYNVVKDAFTTDKGYSDELSNHMLEKVFRSINIYDTYAVNSSDYKEPFKVDFRLKEDSQKVKEDIAYVKMTYSVDIMDSQDKIVGGSLDVHIAFTVKKTGDEWCIIDKYELV